MEYIPTTRCFYCYNEADPKYKVNFTRNLIRVEFSGLHICQRCAESMQGQMLDGIDKFFQSLIMRAEEDIERHKPEVNNNPF